MYFTDGLRKMAPYTWMVHSKTYYDFDERGKSSTLAGVWLFFVITALTGSFPWSLKIRVSSTKEFSVLSTSSTNTGRGEASQFHQNT